MERLSKRHFLSRIIIASVSSIILMLIAFIPLIGVLLKYAEQGNKNIPPDILISYMPKIIVIMALAGCLSLYGTILFLILLYRAWDAIQDNQTRTTPGTAVGFLFIPLFNIYWIFRAVGDYGKEYNNYARRHILQVEPLNEGTYRAIAWLNLCTALIPYVGLLTGLVECFLLFAIIGPTCDAVNALDGAPATGMAPTTNSTPAPAVVSPSQEPDRFIPPPPAPSRAVIHCSKCGQPSTYGLLMCMACGTALEFSKPEPTPPPAVAAEPVPPTTTAPDQPPPIPTAPATPAPPAATATPPSADWRMESHSLTDAPPLSTAPQSSTTPNSATLSGSESSAPLVTEAIPSQPNQAEQPNLGFPAVTKPSPVEPTPATTDVSSEKSSESVPPAATPATPPPARPVDQLTAILTQESKSPALMKLLHLPRANDLAMLRYVNQPLNLINVEGDQEQFNPQDYTEADLLWAEGVMALMAKIKAKIVTGDFTEVLSLILKGLELAPGEEKLLLALADCYTELGEFGRAIKVLENAQQLYPQNSRVKLNLEMVRAKIG